jgi:hypothetical protein
MLATTAWTCEELIDVDVSTLCDSEVREAFFENRRLSDQLEASAARLLASAHHRGLAASDGASSTAAWARAQTGQRYSEAKASLDAGLACETLPLTEKAWAQGEISASAARTICHGRRDGHETLYADLEESLVRFAADRDFRALDGVIRHYQMCADASDDKPPSEKNHLHLSEVGNRWALTGDLDQLAGRTGDAALRAAMDRPSEGDTRTAAKRRADAFTTIMRFFLDHADLPIEGGERPHITIVLGGETAGHDVRAEQSDVGFTPTDIGELLCDARLSRIVLGADSIPLDAGRAVYAPSKAVRRVVVVRDGGCRFPGCSRRPSWCHTHHVTPWPTGETLVENLVLMCSYHHHVVHTPGWRATFDGRTFEVTNADGRVIGSTENRPRPG